MKTFKNTGKRIFYRGKLENCETPQNGIGRKTDKKPAIRKMKKKLVKINLNPKSMTVRFRTSYFLQYSEGNS